MAPWDQPQKWDSWLAGIVMLTIAMETWLHSDIPTMQPSLADVFLTSLDPLTGAELTELNPSRPFFPADVAAPPPPYQYRLSTRGADDLHPE